MPEKEMYPEFVTNEHGFTARVCVECGQPVSGKPYGWVRCADGWNPRCGAVVCVAGRCRQKHEARHA